MRKPLLFLLAALVAVSGAVAVGAHAEATPNFNVEVILRPAAGGPDNGFGLVKFRQPKDADKIVYLGTWVRGLEPDHSYVLQRAVDPPDGDCTSDSWLPLGKGLVPQTIETDERGTGREELFRDLAAVATGTQFDIHFQVIDAVTGDPVLASGCYRFTVSE